MNIEEAKEILDRIDIKFFLSGMIEQSNYIVDKADEVNAAIYTVLNELDKKDKVIDMMAEDIFDYEKDIKYYVPEYEEFFKNKEEVKEYYFNEIEIPEEN